MMDREWTFEQSLRGSGLTEREIKQVICFSDWSVERFAEEQKTEGWAKRMLAEAAALEQPIIAERTVKELRSRIHANGPRALCERSVGALAELCSPKLRELALGYDPFQHGGRLVCGPTGVGKTAAALATFRRCIAEPAARWWAWASAWDRIGDGKCPTPSGCWVRSFDLVNARLNAGLGKGEADAVNWATKAAFTVIDDLGWESKRANADDVVLEVIAMRYDAGLPTYVSTGLKLDDLIGRYGDAVVRRIQQAGGKSGKVLTAW